MSAKKQRKASNIQTTNQTNNVLDSIQIKTIEKAIKEKKVLLFSVKEEEVREPWVESIIRFIVDPKSESKPEDKKYWLASETIDCRVLQKGQIVDELDKYIDIHDWLNKSNDTLPDDERSKYFSFDTLYIKDLRASDYDNMVAVKLQRLKDKAGKRKTIIKEFNVPKKSDVEKIKKEYSNYSLKSVEVADKEYEVVLERPTIPSVLIVSFMGGEVPKSFRREFDGEFEEIQELEELIEIDHARKSLTYNKKVAILEPKQIELFKLLWDNKDEVVKRNEIDMALWPKTDNEEPESPIQIEQQVNKLRNGLSKLGFKKEIIQTHTKNQLVEEGAYEFHSDLSSFLEES